MYPPLRFNNLTFSHGCSNFFLNVPYLLLSLSRKQKPKTPQSSAGVISMYGFSSFTYALNSIDY